MQRQVPANHSDEARSVNLDTGTLWLLIMLVLAGTFANDFWRLAGVLLSRNLKPESMVIIWAKDVSTALLAGLVARFLFYPPELLANVPLAVRLAGFAGAILAFLLSGGRLALSLGLGLGVFLAAQWLWMI
jgi:hypothetical protein